MRHNKLQKCTRMSIQTSYVLMTPEPPIDGEHTPNPYHKGKIPIRHTDIPKTYQCTGKPMNEWGCKLKGRHPIQGRCKGIVQHVRGPLQPPQHAEVTENIQMHRKMGMCGGCRHPWVVYKCMGHTNIQGVQT